MRWTYGVIAVALAACAPTDDPEGTVGPGGGDVSADGWGSGGGDGTLLYDSSGPVYSLIAVADTWLKSSTAPAGSLDDDHRCLVPAGEELLLDGFAMPAADGLHYRVELLERLDGCGLREGLIYGDHFIVNDGAAEGDIPAGAFVIAASGNTYFKRLDAESDALSDSERCLVRAGERLSLVSPPTQARGMHFRARLVRGLEGCGFTDGYVYGPHFGLEPERVIEAQDATVLKSRVASSSELGARERCDVAEGAILQLLEPPLVATERHYRVRLAQPVPGCGLEEGYVFGPHFGMDPEVVLPVTAETVLKARNVQSSELRAEERCGLEAGDLLELSTTPEWVSGETYRVQLSRRRPGCALTSGYLYGRHVDIDSVLTYENPLSAPYYYQYNNANEPGSTCGLTSAAMLLGAHGRSVTPDWLYQHYGKRQGQSPTGLASIFRQELGYGEGTYEGTRAMIRRNIDQGRPVVIHGSFTGSGHIMLVVGYDATGWILHDPAGRWAGCYRCGYPGRTSTNGRYVHYSYAAMDDSIINADGGIWMSAGSTRPFTL